MKIFDRAHCFAGKHLARGMGACLHSENTRNQLKHGTILPTLKESRTHRPWEGRFYLRWIGSRNHAGLSGAAILLSTVQYLLPTMLLV